MRPIIILTIVGILSASLLAVVDDLTREPIAAAKEKMKRKAIEQIFPFPFDSLRTVTTEETSFHEAYDQEGTLQGIAVESYTDDGYSGRIEFLTGVSPDNTILDYKVLFHRETPGLGDKIDKSKFKKLFKGRRLDNTNWAVKKDGGDIDELTAATISSRAVIDGIVKGLEFVNGQYIKSSAE